MRRSVFIGIIVLVAVLGIGVFFGTQSLGNNAQSVSGDQTQTQATTSPGYFSYAVVGLLLGGGLVFLIRPRRRVVSTAKSE